MLANNFSKNTFSVSEINNLAKNTLENNFSQVIVQGEISSFTNHSSGHWYFTIKDTVSSLDCVMFAGYNKGKAKLCVGNKVELLGKLTLYTASGRYQFLCMNYQVADYLGNLQARLEALRKKLEAEGLFSEIYKKNIPKYPRKIAIVTAVNSAAANDILRVYENKKSYYSKLYFFNSLMQGEAAVSDIISNIIKANDYDFDVILLARGGGSKEDLFCFNNEALIRQIVKSKIPIITGLGHEIDVHLSDLAASKYYATPTAAMNAICFDLYEELMYLDNFSSTFSKLLKSKLEKMDKDLLYFASKFSKKDALIRFNNYKNILSYKHKILNNTLSKNLNNKNTQLQIKQRQINIKSKEILRINEQKLAKYSKNLNQENYKNYISSYILKLENYKYLLNSNLTNKINLKNQKNLSTKNTFNFIIKPKIKERIVKIENYHNVLKSRRDFLESIKEYARIIQDNKGVELNKLKIGDEIELKSIDCIKRAKIIKEIK